MSSKEHDFFVAEIADAVHVIATDPEGQVLMVRQFRVGSRTDSLETPGGLIDPGEDAITAAHRELLEETGYKGFNPKLLGAFLVASESGNEPDLDGGFGKCDQGCGASR